MTIPTQLTLPGIDHEELIGQEVALTFLDHAEDANVPLEFILYGRVAISEDTHICIDSWAYADPDVEYDPNVKRFVIVRSAVTSMRVLK